MTDIVAGECGSSVCPGISVWGVWLWFSNKLVVVSVKLDEWSESFSEESAIISSSFSAKIISLF